MKILTCLLIITVFIVIIIDILPIFNTWQSRIYIGRYISKSIWNKDITKIGVKWLNKTP